MRSRSQRLGSAAVAALVATALAACSASGDSPNDRPVAAPSPAFQGEVPEFSGPYAAEFAEAYRSTTSEVVHQILAKGSITDQDYAAVSSQYVKCVKDKGFTAEVTGPFGEGTVEGDGEGDANEASLACSGDMSVIASLRYLTTRNPQKLDENTIMAACLVKKKLVPPSYSAKDYEGNRQTGKFPFSVDSPEFLACTGDPLGLSTGK